MTAIGEELGLDSRWFGEKSSGAHVVMLGSLSVQDRFGASVGVRAREYLSAGR